MSGVSVRDGREWMMWKRYVGSMDEDVMWRICVRMEKNKLCGKDDVEGGRGDVKKM